MDTAKFSAIFLILILAIFCTWAFLPGFLLEKTKIQIKPYGEVWVNYGEKYIKLAKEKNFEKVKEIKTGEKGIAKITIFDRMHVIIYPNTEIKINDVYLKNKSLQFHIILTNGELWNRIYKTGYPAHYSIKAENKIIDVRGTSFSIEKKGEEIYINVLDGLVEIKNPKKNFKLKALDRVIFWNNALLGKKTKTTTDFFSKYLKDEAEILDKEIDKIELKNRFSLLLLDFLIPGIKQKKEYIKIALTKGVNQAKQKIALDIGKSTADINQIFEKIGYSDSQLQKMFCLQ